MRLRTATEADIDALDRLIRRAMAQLLDPVLTPDQVKASYAVMGLDRQLVADGTYVVVEDGRRLVGCGGWSDRATLYGGDHSAGRDTRRLDPASEPARIRAMYTDPDHSRRGIGRLVLEECERRARAAGFARTQLMATLAGEPLYLACGYREMERVVDMVDGVGVPLIRMERALS